ncbi:hypothetical protein EYC80_006326 [Monilinia laxa]|uniref:Uncharacterized protein n=2 Tax=Monilinia laxa TaxID=61186 RepID=A0A5N6KHF5_MONLA|nr:hypothetical protein EYC80_006326 [Monilinia laxa]
MSDSAQDTQTTPNTPELLSDEIPYHNISSPPSSISTNTHDISRARYHMKELETFAVRVEEAAARAFPNRGRSRYAEVLVVLIKWEGSDVDTQPEFNALRSMFEICYGFTTDTWSIPSTHSHNKLMLQAVNYIEKHGTEDNLIIIYYGGHAAIDNSRQAIWSCNQDISHASVRWSAIQSVFEESKSDVLYLLDCCSAAGAAPSAGPGVIETIAASDFETCAPGPGRHSFTNALLHVLNDWMNRPSFSAAMLHSEILSVLKHDKPQKGRRGDQHKQEKKTTPIYILASEDPKSLSIEICRRTTPGNSWAGTLSSARGEATDIYCPENLHGLTPEGKLAVPHVLISISLEESQSLDVEAWHKWIKQFPALAQFALVEGVFASHSTIILLSLPVLIWDMLPENLAVSFVAFVESRNLLSQISEKLGVEIPKPQQKDFRGRPDSDILQIPPPLPLIQQIEQALHKQKQQAMKDWEANFQKEKVRLEAKVQDARDETQKKELEFLQERAKYREIMERDMREVKKESQVIKEEAIRAWEELGRYEREEQDRIQLLREGQPVSISGVQVFPIGDSASKHDRGRSGHVAAWVGGVRSETAQVPKIREGSRAREPPDLLHDRRYLQPEGMHNTGPEHLPKHPLESTPNYPTEQLSPVHHETNGMAFDVSMPHPPTGLAKQKSNASYKRFTDERSIASFKSIASGVLSPPESVASDEIDESTHEEYESALSGGNDDEDGFGRGDRGSMDILLKDFLDAGDDAPWNLPRQSIIDGDDTFPQDDRDKDYKVPEKLYDPDKITLEPKSYKSESKKEPTKTKDSEPTALLDWERRGMQRKLADHALPRPNPDTALEPMSPEPTKVKDVDPFTLQVLEKGIPQEVVEHVSPEQATPPRTSLELATRTDVGPLTLQALKTYEKLQEEIETHETTRRQERPAEHHIPNRLSHITERDGDWESKSPGKLSSVGTPYSKRRDEKVGDKKALAAVEEAIKKLIIPEMEELKKEPEMTRMNSDGSGTGRVPWDSDEKSAGRAESVKHGKGKSSTKKAFEAVEDAIKKEAEALKKKEEEEEELQALMQLRKGQRERKRKDEEKEKPKRDGEEKDAAKTSSGRDVDHNGHNLSEQKHDGKEVIVEGEKALSAVDDAIRKLTAPDFEGLKRTDSHKSHKSYKSAKSQRYEKSKMSESIIQQSPFKPDESLVKEKLEKGHRRQQSVPKPEDTTPRETTDSNSKSQNATSVEDQNKDRKNSGSPPLQKQKSDRGLWWMERKPPRNQREEQPRDQPDSEDKPEISDHTWQRFKFANRDVTPSMSSLPTAIPRSSLNPSTFAPSHYNAWSQSENSFSTVLQPRTSLDYSRDPRTPLDFSLARDESPHSQPSTTSDPNVYSQFPPLSEDHERPFSTPRVPTPMIRAPSPPDPHPSFTPNHNPNNPYSQFAQFEQSLSTPTLQRISTGTSFHSLDDSARSIHNVPINSARSIHNVPITSAHSIHNVPMDSSHSIHNVPLTSHPILQSVFRPSTYHQHQDQHAPISAVSTDSNPKHSFTFTTAPQGPTSSHQSPPFFAAELPAFPHSLSLTRSDSLSHPPRYQHQHHHQHPQFDHPFDQLDHSFDHSLDHSFDQLDHSLDQLDHPFDQQDSRDRREGQLSSQASYLTQPLPSPSPSETETLLKNLILPELETLEKGERARREEEERSKREWEREFGILSEDYYIMRSTGRHDKKFEEIEEGITEQEQEQE